MWKWCFENDDETLVTGWKEIEGKWYYLNPNGTMETGWTKVKDKWYYLDPTNGDMKTGWLQDKDKWYYLADNGVMYCDCNVTIDDKNYYFNKDGVMSLNILSIAGADFIGSWEGFWDKAKPDPCYGISYKKYWTIGYGTTYEARPDAFPNGLDSVCTLEQARQWLIEEGQDKAEEIKSDLDSKGIVLKQHELDALISFAYNCGTDRKTGLLGSTLYKNVVNGVRDAETIKDNFVAWNKANGKVKPGLTRRREGEAALFLNADYTGNN